MKPIVPQSKRLLHLREIFGPFRARQQFPVSGQRPARTRRNCFDISAQVEFSEYPSGVRFIRLNNENTVD